jgi:uncharacterized protein (DUF1330 family)
VAKAYWVNVYRSINDEAALARYASLAVLAIESHGGRFLARGKAARCYEAGLLQRVVIVEFPDLESATAAHDSAQYQAALVALGGTAERDLRIVEGPD